MKRTVMYSRSGKNLYAVRDAKGRFRDIQSYKKSHAQDIKRRSQAETAAKAKANAKPKGRAK